MESPIRPFFEKYEVQMLKNIIMIILLIIGMVCLMSAKISFQQRQLVTPDNAWSDREKKLRRLGYGILIGDVIIAGFINF